MPKYLKGKVNVYKTTIRPVLLSIGREPDPWHAVIQFFDNLADESIVVKLDFSNAIYSLLRDQMLQMWYVLR